MPSEELPATSPSTSEPLLVPSSTIVRIKRKRCADPVAGLVVCPKKSKINDGEIAEEIKVEATDSKDTMDNLASEIVFRLVGTSETPHARGAAPFLEKEHKVVEMVDFDLKKKLLGKRQVSVLDYGYLEMMKAAKALSDFGFDEAERRELEKDCTAPLAQSEVLEAIDEDMESGEYVYDFYYSASGKRMVNSPDAFDVRLPTDEELQLFYGGDEEEDSIGADDDQDSNEENYYKNDYPDEDDLENESTTDDDTYDHYGDEHERYSNYCKGSSDEDY